MAQCSGVHGKAALLPLMSAPAATSSLTHSAWPPAQAWFGFGFGLGLGLGFGLGFGSRVAKPSP